MKVKVPVIKLVLRTNKVLSDKSNPIMLRCSFDGMKERSTGYSCTLKYWDKKSECILKGFPNYALINAELKKQKDEAIRKRDEYIANDEVFTPSMILAKEEVRNAATNDFKGLIERYIDEKGLEKKTVEKWWIAYRSVIKYCGRDDLLINEVNEAFCRKYCRWLEDRGISVGTIRSYMAKVVALLHYAVSLSLIDDFPLGGWKYHKDYRPAKRELYIHSRTLSVMLEMFLDEVIVRNGNRWKYRDGVIEQLMNVRSNVYVHYLYVIGVWMKGISSIDISMLKKKDLKVVMLKGKNYYAIDGNRSKTGSPFKIRVLQNCLESNVLIRTMLMYNEGEWFLPTLNGYEGQLRNRVGNVYAKNSGKLREWFQRINEEIARRNVENDDDIPLIDLECTYNSARHSYIMKEIQKGDVNLLRLATETGKALSSLHQYLTYLNDEDLV